LKVKQEAIMNKIENRSLSGRAIVSKFLFLTVAMILIAALGVAQAQAKATTVVTNFDQETDLTVFVPCAALGAGEYVQLSGSLHVLFTTTIDNRGGFHTTFLFQPMGISGTGLSTGDKYQATGETQGTLNGDLSSGQPYEQTFVNNFKIIGQGPGNNFLVYETFHITVNPDGTVTAFVDNLKIKCKPINYPG
jgi:hypothetical protein